MKETLTIFPIDHLMLTLACIFNRSLWKTKIVDISCTEIVNMHT